jgi:PmbA protein
MLDELQARANDAVKMALDAGATDAWASATRNRSVDFSMRDGAVEKVQDSTSRSLSISIYVGGRYSSHSTNDLRPDRLAPFVKEAVALTGHLQEDEYRRLPDPTLFEGRATTDLQLVDTKVREIDRTQRMQWLEAMNAEIDGKDKVISAESSVSDGHSGGAAASSNGFTGTWENTWTWLGASVSLQDEGDRRPEAGMWAGCVHLDDLPDPAGIAIEGLRRGMARLGSVKGPSTNGTMVVDPTSAGRLIRALLGPANGRGLQQKKSFWADKKGQAVISDKLTLIDDPLIPRGFSSKLFDGEGIAAKKRTIVEGGALQEFYINTYYARKLGVAPTTGGSSNRIVGLGDKALAEIISDVGTGIYVTGWLGGNSDRTTGDFSFGLQGHLIEGGAIGAPVGEMNVTGNLIDLFAKLTMVGNDPWPYSSLKAPTIVFEGVDFSGA